MRSEGRLVNSTNNIIYGMLNKVVMLVLTFISRAIFVKVLSADYLGINGLFTDVLTMLSLADLGLGSAMAYSFYKPLAEKNEKQLSALIRFYSKIYTFIAIAVALVGIAIVPFLKYIVNTDKDIAYLELYYLVFLANTVISYLFVYKSTIITADQKSYMISKYAMWINFVKVILQIIVLYLTKNYLIYIAVSLFTTFANNLLISRKADKLYPFIKNRADSEEIDKKNIFADIKSLFLYKLSSVILTGTDNILISIMVGTAAVGLYSNYHIITYNLTTISTLFFNSITASVGNIIVKENENKRHETFKLMQMVSFWLSGVFAICVLLLSQEFIELWLGSSYLLSNGTLIAIVLNFYLALSLPPVWSFREATGLFQKTKYIMLITATVNILLSLVLGHIWGIGGIIVATFIAKVATYFWYEPNLLYTLYFKKSCIEYYVGHLINLVVVAVSIILLNFVASGVRITGWFSLVIKAIIIFLLINLIYLLRYIMTKEFKLVVSKCLDMVRNRR